MEIVILWLLFAIFSAVLASYKNRSALAWFFIGLVCGPFGLLVGAFPKLQETSPGTAKPQSTSTSVLKESATPPKDPEFEDEWNTLVKYDSTATEAVEKLESYGLEALEELKKAHKAVKDKSQLPKIADKIISDIESERQREGQEKKGTAYVSTSTVAKEAELMKRHNIFLYEGKYVYGDHRYENLEDAVRYAVSHSKE
jgi:hypothetical protein